MTQPRNPYTEGQISQRQGRKIRDCPYRIKGLDRARWIAGWGAPDSPEPDRSAYYAFDPDGDDHR